MPGQIGQEWRAGRVTVPRNKRSPDKPYFGHCRDNAKSHVEVHWRTMYEEAFWCADNAYIRIGKLIAKQLKLPQGYQMSPPLAIAHSIMLVHIKYLRLKAAGILEPDRLNMINAVIRLLSSCVAQYMDDVAAHFPYLLSRPDTHYAALFAMSEVHDLSPILTGLPTYPHPLQLIKEVDGP